MPKEKPAADCADGPPWALSAFRAHSVTWDLAPEDSGLPTLEEEAPSSEGSLSGCGGRSLPPQMPLWVRWGRSPDSAPLGNPQLPRP